MTPNDLIKLALKQAGVVGVGQTPMAEDVNDAFALLNMMLGQWNRRRWLVYHLVEASLVSTGAATYSVGAGGDFNVPRTNEIESAFLRLLTQAPPNQIDYPLAIIQSYEDWARVPSKGQSGFPQAVFLDTGFPLGTLYVWPVPPAGLYEIHIVLKAELAGFAKLSDDLTLPNEYQEALLYNLAARLIAAYKEPPDPTVTALAMTSLNTIRKANVQVPKLQMPANLTGNGLYNIYTDQVR